MSDLVTRLSVLAEDDGDHYPTHVKKLAEAAASRITALDAAIERAEKAEAKLLSARVAELEGALTEIKKRAQSSCHAGKLVGPREYEDDKRNARRLAWNKGMYDAAKPILRIAHAALKEKTNAQG